MTAWEVDSSQRQRKRWQQAGDHRGRKPAA